MSGYQLNREKNENISRCFEGMSPTLEPEGNRKNNGKKKYSKKGLNNDSEEQQRRG